mmetsp:Transcript_50700/g.126222  ORF Transcript_50700/g.126222 Transcript_50700/m.126222 type:complete len:296 (-) Transcript_50700:57-944(-)
MRHGQAEEVDSGTTSNRRRECGALCVPGVEGPRVMPGMVGARVVLPWKRVPLQSLVLCACLLAAPPLSLGSHSLAYGTSYGTVGLLRLRGGDRTRWDMFKQLFRRYDADNNQILNREELKSLLTEVQHGTVPTDHEVMWILKGCELCESPRLMGDAGCEVTVTVRQLPPLIKMWFKYLSHKPFIEKSLKTFDVSHTGGLLRDELFNFLKHLEGASVPSEGELDVIFSSLDTKNDGNIDRFELLHLINVWYTLSAASSSTETQGSLRSSSDDIMTKLADTLTSKPSPSNPCSESQV